MEQFLTWTKGTFESNYQIFQEGQIKTSLVFDNWKNEARTLFSSTNLLFRANGIFDTTVQVLGDDGNFLGNINFEMWQTRATITLKDGEQAAFAFAGSWYTQWSITDAKGTQISYQSNSNSGRIHANTDDQMLLIIGLFIREYYTRRFFMLMMFAAFLCIFTNII